MTQEPIPEVMDVRQAAAYLQVSADTLYRYASDGFLPAFKFGNLWRFSKTALNQWIESESMKNIRGDRS